MTAANQIKEMAYSVCRLENKPKDCTSCMWKATCNEYLSAESYYNAGYRKQIEGEWLSNCQTDEYICSLCNSVAPVDCEKENFYKSSFCPNCGAKMKGR